MAASFVSSLNPNAPYFFPAYFSAAEDFSPEWWHLVQTCPAFQEYWLTERFDPEFLLAADAQISSDADPFADLDFEDADLEENLSPSAVDECRLHMCFGKTYKSGVLFDESALCFKEFAMKASLKEVIGGVKQTKHEYSPLPYQTKPLKVAHPQKPALHKIQQPR